MLSFVSGIPLCYIIESIDYNSKEKKKPKILKTVYYQKVDEDAEPEFEAEPKDVLYEDDFEDIKKKFKLSKYDLIKLKNYIGNLKKLNWNKHDIDNKIEPAFIYTMKLVKKNLKTQLRFTEYKDITIIPAIDTKLSKNSVTHVLCCGNSGSGKSSLINLCLSLDHKKKPIILYSRIGEGKDPSLKDIL